MLLKTIKYSLVIHGDIDAFLRKIHYMKNFEWIQNDIIHFGAPLRLPAKEIVANLIGNRFILVEKFQVHCFNRIVECKLFIRVLTLCEI